MLRVRPPESPIRGPNAVKSEGQPPLVYVVTLTWNQKADTLKCLESLSGMTYPRYRILVVDNGSSDGTLSATAQEFPEAETIANAENLGFGGGFNVGICSALERGAAFVLIINNDTHVAPDMLDALMVHSQRENVGMLAPKIYYADEPTRIWSVGGNCHPWTYEMTDKGDDEVDRGQWEEVLERDYLVGCAILMRRSMLETVGMFDEDFYPIYYEDVDLCLRTRRAGYKLLLVPAAKMWHEVSASAGGSDSPRERYLMARHSIRFFRKYVRGWRWLVVAPYRAGSAVKTVARLLWRRRYNAATSYLRGLYDGLRGSPQSV